MQVFDKDHFGGAVKFKVDGLLDDANKAGEVRYTVRYCWSAPTLLRSSLIAPADSAAPCCCGHLFAVWPAVPAWWSHQAAESRGTDGTMM